MASTVFVDGETLIEASWLNDVNSVVYNAGTVTANNVANTPAGNISATDVQAAINELDTEKQPVSSKLTDIAALAVTDGNIIVGNGTTWVAENDATARTSLGAQATLVSGTNIKTVDGNSLLGSGDITIIPDQTGNSGKFLTTNGSTVSWGSSNNNNINIIDVQKPTSSVQAIAKTELSGYSNIGIIFAATTNTTGTVYAQARTSGGTWRNIGEIAVVSTISSFMVRVEIFNFNDDTNPKAVNYTYSSRTGVLDRSNAANLFTTNEHVGHSLNTYSEVWDEVRIYHSASGYFEGSTTDQRAWFAVYSF